MNQKTLGLIGFGNMGAAIAQQISSKYQLYIYDKDKNKTNGLSGIRVSESITGLIKQVEIGLLAVKPQDFDFVLNEIKNGLKNQLIISIAAGISTGYIQKALGEVRVVRAMPNIGVKIGESVTCLCAGRFAAIDDLACAQELFGYLGKVKEIKEDLMNASTAISGSGPGYIFDYFESEAIAGNAITGEVKENIIQRLASAAKAVGFNEEEAQFLAVNTSDTSIDLIKKTGLSPSELRKQVTSKGGTTEAAIEVIRRGGSWIEAAKAAVARAKELSKEG